MNDYLMKDRALNNTWRIERNERVDVDKVRLAHVLRKCEDVRKRNENWGRGRDFAPSQYQARSFLARNLRPSYRSTAPFAIAPFILSPVPLWPPYASAQGLLCRPRLPLFSALARSCQLVPSTSTETKTTRNILSSTIPSSRPIPNGRSYGSKNDA